ncbi:MAG: aminotransferase class IV [Puniceicoccales bacterium]|jgi:4-amino-4-deoxychorismate lyase|nr:aminotransferase class IV [Puniceicoccales bacterium]
MNAAWLDGKIVEANAPGIALTDHGLLFGASFFETFRTTQRKPGFILRHLRRLENSCNTIGIHLADTLLGHGARYAWDGVLGPLLDANGLDDAVIRYTVTAGPAEGGPGSAHYLQPHEFLLVRPLPPPADRITLHLLEGRRTGGEWHPRPKSGNYLNSLIRAQEFAKRGDVTSGDEALVLNSHGEITEGVFSSVFWLRDGVWSTPRLETGALPGVGREVTIEAAKRLGFAVHEVAQGFEAICQATAVFITSSVRGIVPVSRIIDTAGIIVWNAGKPISALTELIEEFEKLR